MMREWWSKLTGWRETSQRTDDWDEEIASHIELETQAHISQGMSPEEARAAARRRFGSVTFVKENASNAWRFPAFDALIQDLRYGMRNLLRTPAVSLVIIATLALGIGVNTALFSVIQAVLLKPLPYPNSERLTWLGEGTSKAEGISVTWGNFRHWQRENHSFERMAGFNMAHATLAGRGEPVLMRNLLVTHDYFALTGMRPLLGRLFDANDDRQGQPYTVVLNYGFWQERFGGDPGVLNTTLALDGKAYTVIGVASPSWHFQNSKIDAFIPLGLYRSDSMDRSLHGSMRALGLLKPGITLQAARADLDGIMSALAKTQPGPENEHRSAGMFLISQMTDDVRPALLMMMGAVVLVLLIACSNVASLLLARGTSRAGELAVRAAIGAGRMRLVRQLVTENLLLAAIGGIAGVTLAYLSLRLLLRLAPAGIPRLNETHFDPAVLAFSLAISLCTGLLVSMAPVWNMRKLDLVTAMKDSSRNASASRSGQRMRSLLVLTEISLTVVLAFAATLLLRSLIGVENAKLGFSGDNLITLEMVLGGPVYKNPEARRVYYERLEREIAALPGVNAMSAVMCPPLAEVCNDWFYSVEGRPAPPPNEVPLAVLNNASPSYFRMMSIPVIQGRAFRDTDRPGSIKVAIVNEALAKQRWPHENPIGQRIKVGGPYREGDTYEIVGVVGNVGQNGINTEVLPEIYMPIAEGESGARVLMIRTAGRPADLISAVRRAAANADRNTPIQRLQTMEERLTAIISQRRFGTMLLTAFAALAVLLASVGVYGLLSYWVSSREQDLAIRMALGASGRAILTCAGAQTFRLTAAGLAIGIVAALGASKWMQSMVYDIEAASVSTLIIAALAVTMLASLAASFPLWRAMRVDVSRRLHHI